MSVINEINRIKSAVSSSYDAVSDKGGTVPDISSRNVENLATAIASIPGDTRQTIVDSNGQVLYTSGEVLLMLED